jgi:hypothetical protein
VIRRLASNRRALLLVVGLVVLARKVAPKVAEVLPKVADVLPAPLKVKALPVVAKLTARRALRTTLLYQREFGAMPGDWQTRETEYKPGQNAKGDDSQSWCYDGNLVLGIKADPETPGKYLVGHVRGPTFPDPYGFYEALIKFPAAPGVLAGWWLQSEPPYDTPQHVEVDIAENYGNPNVHHTIWFRPEGAPWGVFEKVPDPHLITDLGSGEAQTVAHKLGVRVTPTGYAFFVDGVNVGVVREALTDTPKYMVFSLKVPDYLLPSLDPNNLPARRMRIAWVRKYAL